MEKTQRLRKLLIGYESHCSVVHFHKALHRLRQKCRASVEVGWWNQFKGRIQLDRDARPIEIESNPAGTPLLSCRTRRMVFVTINGTRIVPSVCLTCMSCSRIPVAMDTNSNLWLYSDGKGRAGFDSCTPITPVTKHEFCGDQNREV